MLIQEYADRILDEVPLKVFQSSSHDGGRIRWPWRMFPPAEATPRYVKISQTYAVDSEPQSPAVDNQQVLDCAYELGADVVLLVDYFPWDMYDSILWDADGKVRDGKEDDVEELQRLKDEHGSSYEASLHSIKQGLDLLEDHPYDGQVWVPLQPPHVESYRELGEPDAVAIGGVKDANGKRKVEVAREVRAEVGPETYVHGLGFGASLPLVEAVRSDPDLLDSIDSKRVGAESIKNQDIWSGDEQSTPLACYVLAGLLENCRRFAGIADHPSGGEMSTLHDW